MHRHSERPSESAGRRRNLTPRQVSLWTLLGAGRVAWLWMVGLSWPAWAAQDRICLSLDRLPADGRVVARVDLTEAARWCGQTIQPERLRAFVLPESNSVPAQFVPDPHRPGAGVIVLQCKSAAGPVRVCLDFSGPAAPKPPSQTSVRTRWFTLQHDPKAMGGLPTAVTFTHTGWQVPCLHWNDRLYHRQAGSFALRYDPEPQVQCLATGPVCTVMRVRARYTQPDGRQPASQPEVVYDWFYFHDQPLVLVRGMARQQSPQPWHEAHFLELAFATNAFAHWVGGEPRQEGTFAGRDQPHRFSQWALVRQGANALGLFEAGPVVVYDGRSYGPYLHADADAAWRQWSSAAWERTAWLWIGPVTDPAAAESAATASTGPLTQAASSLSPGGGEGGRSPGEGAVSSTPRAAAADALARLARSGLGAAVVRVSSERLQQRIEQHRALLRQAQGPERQVCGWTLARTRLLEQQGRFAEALEAGEPGWPKDWVTIAAGDLRLVLERRPDGLALLTLADAATGRLLVGPEAPPLFEVTLRAGTNETRLRADQGWGQVRLEPAPETNTYTFRWRQAQAAGLGGFEATLHLRADAGRHRLAWELEAGGQADPWSLWEVRFPQLALWAEEGPAHLLLPQGAGVLKEVGRQALAPLRGEYPGGWLSMQLAAFYDSAAGTGLYFGLHDPTGATKRFTADHPEANTRAVRLAWDIPAPDMGRPGNRFVLPGQAVWQLLRGDWFDAALIYRDWVRAHARWFPKLGPEGRADTPLWMRELCAWAMTGGPPNQCVPAVLEFAKALGLPVGFHWYNWHQIPFDNDYPHYFPAREGFTAGVQQLQQAGVAVMPYINGRLWDSRDRGTDDWLFSSLARPAATKKQDGEPYLESYGSKETNGQPVRLAVMCPATKLWQERVAGVVGRLLGECGVRAVYIDQIAAAEPVLCFDATHGHPLGGGSWWNEAGYWPMLEAIRRDKPAEVALTTECNAEPFIRWLDGYLTWHWQHDGQVPLFPAVYGGAIQMFGRAYRGGPTKDLALRMKAGQQLVWGEQLGWLEPAIVREPENFAFFSDAVRLRWQLRRYFYAGQMARPPGLEGSVPTVTADWQWSGVWPVTTPAVLTGAWHLPAERRLALLFANVTDTAVTARVRYDLAAEGLSGSRLVRRRWTPQGSSLPEPAASPLDETVTFPPRQVWAWELSAAD